MTQPHHAGPAWATLASSAPADPL